MWPSTSSLTALLVLSPTINARPATQECKANGLAGADTLHYIIDPEYIIFPFANSLSDLISSTKNAKAMVTDIKDVAIKQVPQLFGEPCTLTMRVHSTAKVPPSQLENLISTSMSNTELFCHSAAIKIHKIYTDSHTMMSRNTTIHFAQPGVNVRDSPSVSYEVDCKAGQGKWKQTEDCAFCKILQGELEGMCSKASSPEQAAMGRMADEMGVGFGVARCVSRNRGDCEVTNALFSG
jgi:hypothetical protein